VTTALQRHRDTCAARVPELRRRIVHTKSDLRLLAALKERLDVIMSNQTSNSSMNLATILPQIHHSMKLFETPYVASMFKLDKSSGRLHGMDLMQTRAGATSPNGEVTASDVQRMYALLGQLVVELQAVEMGQQSEIDNITVVCDAQEKDLLQSQKLLTDTIERAKETSKSREYEIAQVSLAIQNLTLVVNIMGNELDQLNADTAIRMQGYLTFVKTRQNTMVILSEMRTVLDELLVSLSNLPMPELASSAPPATYLGASSTGPTAPV